MRKFHELFAGRGDVYGTYALSKAQKTTEKGEKRLGKAKTVTDTEVTIALYDAHINGEQSLGIVPIRLDDTVVWFAIDVDNYGDDKLHERLAGKISRLNLPLMIFRSKSGGAHLFCFLTEPITAIDARTNAQKFVAALGLPKNTEIFPKQEAINRSDGGSWINLPYFGKTRPCLGIDGKTELSLKEFLILAEKCEVHPSDLGFRQKEVKDRKEDSGDEAHKGAPPCIVTMLRDGIEEGGRDNAMTHLAVYLKRAFPDDWEEMLFAFNDEICSPPLSTKEIFRISKSAQRKDYQYLCKQTPMVGLCDKPTCLKRKYGIGDGEGETANFTIDSIRKVGSEDPYYIIMVDGLPIRLKSKDLLHFPEFRKAVFETHDKLIGIIKPSEWSRIINEAIATNFQKEEAPDEVGTSGAIISQFMDWTASRLITGDTRDRVADGQPYFDKEKKEIIFRGNDFLAYLRRQTGGKYDDRVVWLVLSEEGASQERATLSGREFNLWKYPVREPWFELHHADGVTI